MLLKDRSRLDCEFLKTASAPPHTLITFYKFRAEAILEASKSIGRLAHAIPVAARSLRVYRHCGFCDVHIIYPKSNADFDIELNES
jgi:hypothetical protein